MAHEKAKEPPACRGIRSRLSECATRRNAQTRGVGLRFVNFAKSFLGSMAEFAAVCKSKSLAQVAPGIPAGVANKFNTLRDIDLTRKTAGITVGCLTMNASDVCSVDVGCGALRLESAAGAIGRHIGHVALAPVQLLANQRAASRTAVAVRIRLVGKGTAVEQLAVGLVVDGPIGRGARHDAVAFTGTGMDAAGIARIGHHG